MEQFESRGLPESVRLAGDMPSAMSTATVRVQNDVTGLWCEYDSRRIVRFIVLGAAIVGGLVLLVAWATGATMNRQTGASTDFLNCVLRVWQLPTGFAAVGFAIVMAMWFWWQRAAERIPELNPVLGYDHKSGRMVIDGAATSETPASLSLQVRRISCRRAGQVSGGMAGWGVLVRAANDHRVVLCALNMADKDTLLRLCELIRDAASTRGGSVRVEMSGDLAVVTRV